MTQKDFWELITWTFKGLLYFQGFILFYLIIGIAIFIAFKILKKIVKNKKKKTEL